MDAGLAGLVIVLFRVVWIFLGMSFLFFLLDFLVNKVSGNYFPKVKEQSLLLLQKLHQQTINTMPTPQKSTSVADQAQPTQPQRKQLHILVASTTSCILNMIKLRVQYSSVSCPQWPHLTFKEMHNCQCTQITGKQMFKGLSVSLFHALISNTLYMQLYQYQRSIFVNHLSSSMATLASAMSSRLLVTFVMNPIQAFRVRFTNSTQHSKITQSKSSLKVTLVRDLTYSCLYWFTIEKIRNLLMGNEYRTHKGEKSILYANVIPAMVGGSLISAITTPLDTVKTRLQSGLQIEGSLLQKMNYIYKRQGLPGLFSGVQYRVIRNTISSVLYLTLFERIIEYLQTSKYSYIN